MKKFIGDFKDFINKGNIADLAIAVVIGGAFGKIVSSFVANIINPLIGLIIGRIHLDDLKVVLRAADEAAGMTELALSYGVFLQALMDFLIIALSIFLAMRIFKRLTSEAKKHANETKKQIKERISVLTEGSKTSNDISIQSSTQSEAQAATDGDMSQVVTETDTDALPLQGEEAAVAEKNFTEDGLQLLREIRDLLKKD